jgi:hypothetical protein
MVSDLVHALLMNPPSHSLPPEDRKPGTKRRYQQRRSLSPASLSLYEEEMKNRRQKQQAAYRRRRRAHIKMLPAAERVEAERQERSYGEAYRAK